MSVALRVVETSLRVLRNRLSKKELVVDRRAIIIGLVTDNSCQSSKESVEQAEGNTS